MCVQLNQLIIANLRNLTTVDLHFGPQFNVFVGANGSGKTSLLEAIYLLGLGRSFRARSARQFIAFGAKNCLVRANVSMSNFPDGIWLALERFADGNGVYKVGAEEEKSAAALAKILPSQLIDVNSHLLLDGGPQNRREFMDWGVFHVEHNFLQEWRALQRTLLQRNMMLKQRQAPTAWNEAFARYAAVVDHARDAYINKFKQEFLQLVVKMLGLKWVELRYNRGWSEEHELPEVLQKSLASDLQYGYTTKGPHRADLEILIGGRPAKEVLSRGQMKIFVCIMLLARAKLLPSTQKGIFLVDDLHAELDKQSCGLLIQALKAMGCQVFITGIEAGPLLERLEVGATNMFHVEHGKIKELTIA